MFVSAGVGLAGVGSTLAGLAGEGLTEVGDTGTEFAEVWFTGEELVGEGFIEALRLLPGMFFSETLLLSTSRLMVDFGVEGDVTEEFSLSFGAGGEAGSSMKSDGGGIIDKSISLFAAALWRPLTDCRLCSAES